jgi:hypothetical protein
LLVNLPSLHPGALACPFTFEVLRTRERAPTPSPSVVFTFGFTFEELGGVSYKLGDIIFIISCHPYSNTLKINGKKECLSGDE